MLLHPLLRPRHLPWWFRVTVIIATCFLIFWPYIWPNITVVIEGSPVAYLLLVPVWALTITLTTDHTPEPREVQDADVDRILAVVLIVVGLVTSEMILPRLAAVAIIWRAHLFGLTVWLLAGSLWAFGLRWVVRDRPMWFFIFSCFPPIFLLAGQTLGGSVVVYGSLTAFYGAVAMFIALRKQTVKWFVAPTFWLAGTMGTIALRHGPTVVAYLAPSAVLTAVTLVLFIRGWSPPNRPLPPRSALAPVVAVAVAFALSHAPHHQLPYTHSANLPRVAPDWPTSLGETGLQVSGPRQFDWGPRLMGGGGSVVRYRLTSSDWVGYLDVFSTREYGRLTDFCCGIWYATAPPTDVHVRVGGPPGRITTLGELSNESTVILRSGDPSWIARHWVWRLQDGNETMYQSLYLLTSANAGGIRNVATPRPPNFRTAVLRPFVWLVQDRHATPPPIPPEVPARLTETAWSIVDTATGGPHR